MQTALTMLGSAWQILVLGILLGAGLPAVFALGLRALSPTGSGSSDSSTALGHVPLARKVLAGVCFAVVAAAVVVGIVFLVVTGHR
jgi:hypothetical protein